MYTIPPYLASKYLYVLYQVFVRGVYVCINAYLLFHCLEQKLSISSSDFISIYISINQKQPEEIINFFLIFRMGIK